MQSVTNSPSPSLLRTYVSSSSILETLGCETCSFTTVNTHVFLEFSRIARHHSIATMYSLLIAKPRQQVKAAVDHQMWIKMVFLGYLRELQQADQSFGRRMLEDRPMTEEELNGFKRAIQDTMTKGLIHMRQVWSKGTDLPTSETGGGLGRVHPPSAAGTRIAPIE